MRAELGSVGCDMLDITGIGYDPLRNKWFLMNNSGNDAIPVPFIGSRCDLEMNYILAAKKRYT